MKVNIINRKCPLFGYEKKPNISSNRQDSKAKMAVERVFRISLSLMKVATAAVDKLE